MKKISPKIIELCKSFRKDGLSHRDIAKKLGLGLGTVFAYSKDITLTNEQHLLLKRKSVYAFDKDQRRQGGINCPNKFEIKYKKEDLISTIKSFVQSEGRIPTKREVESHKPYVRVFGSWNNAIRAAGYKANPVKFSKKRIAKDGHKCDSFSEMIIDDWLCCHKIKHQIHPCYPNSNMSSDFLIKDDTRIEFIGLEGQSEKYDYLLEKKRKMVKEMRYKVIEIKPDDLFPVNKLDRILNDLIP